MKYILTALIIFSLNFVSTSQIVSTIHVSGKNILGPCNDTLILRGINYAPYNWGNNSTDLKIDQIALSNSNCVRMVWYKNPVPALYGNLVYLDSAISKCIQKKMIPIVELHDQTCNNSPSALITLATWYTQASMLTIINKYKHSLILNIANEALYVAWASNSVAAKAAFTNTYTSIVNSLRGAGITVPLLIDGPECGTNLDVLANIGTTLQNNDPLKNLIFSAHGYWYSYAGNDSTQMAGKINYAISKNIPFILGEVANLQDDTVNCLYTLKYQALLRILRQKKIGWLSWSWGPDVCPTRQISTNGLFSSLSPYGNDIINNSVYGLATTAVKSVYLQNNKTCPASTDIENFNKELNVLIYPNPSLGSFEISSGEVITDMKVFDLIGNEVKFEKNGNETYSLFAKRSGIYFVRVSANNSSVIRKLIVV